MGTVLVVTKRADHTADLIVSELLARKVPVMRLDPGAGFVDLDVQLVSGRWRNVIRDQHRAVRLEEIVSVLWRWPAPPAGHPTIVDAGSRAWAAREDTAALYGVLRTLPVRWINHPDRVAAASFKPRQLVVAAEAGFSVPDTLITTSGETAYQWARKRKVLYKAFHAQGVNESEMILASPVNPAELPPKLRVASIFQEIIVGQHVRVTSIAHKSFSVAIEGAGRIDWRAVPEVTYTPAPVPDRVHDALQRYMTRFGLEYGAFDLVIDKTGDWVFLECNPLGMYGFVEIATGLPITAAIATRLCEPPPPVDHPTAVTEG